MLILSKHPQNAQPIDYEALIESSVNTGEGPGSKGEMKAADDFL